MTLIMWDTIPILIHHIHLILQTKQSRKYNTIITNPNYLVFCYYPLFLLLRLSHFATATVLFPWMLCNAFSIICYVLFTVVFSISYCSVMHNKINIITLFFAEHRQYLLVYMNLRRENCWTASLKTLVP